MSNLDQGLYQESTRRRLDRWLLVVCPLLLALTFGIALVNSLVELDPNRDNRLATKLVSVLALTTKTEKNQKVTSGAGQLDPPH